MRKMRGFTLIELLVVVAIISVLVALLLPALGKARSQAKLVTCLSNTRQIGTAIMMYTEDYSGSYPPMWVPTSTPPLFGTWYPGWEGNYWAWHQLLYPYTNSEKVYLCPGIDREFAKGTYGCNDFLMHCYHPKKVSRVEIPANTYLVMDACMYGVNNRIIFDYGTPNYYLPGMGDAGFDIPAGCWNVQDAQSGRHNSGVCITFADGHSAWQNSGKVGEECLNSCAGEISAWANVDAFGNYE